MKTHEPTRSANVGATNGVGGSRRFTRSRKAFTWSQVERDTIGQLVQDVCDAGHGLVLGRTADGGALSITVLQGDERIREWPASVEDVAHFAGYCTEQFGGLSLDADS